MHVVILSRPLSWVSFLVCDTILQLCLERGGGSGMCDDAGEGSRGRFGTKFSSSCKVSCLAVLSSWETFSTL